MQIEELRRVNTKLAAKLANVLVHKIGTTPRSFVQNGAEDANDGAEQGQGAHIMGNKEIKELLNGKALIRRMSQEFLEDRLEIPITPENVRRFAAHIILFEKEIRKRKHKAHIET